MNAFHTAHEDQHPVLHAGKHVKCYALLVIEFHLTSIVMSRKKLSERAHDGALFCVRVICR